MKMIYILSDNDCGSFECFAYWEDALQALKEMNEDSLIFITDEEMAAIRDEMSKRVYKAGDGAWWDMVWCDEDERIQGCIYQRPLIGKGGR